MEKDIDFDGILDTVYVDKGNKKIICLLSSKKYVKLESKKIGLNTMSGTSDDGKQGFVFENHYMRAGYSNKFRYDKKAKKIRLIGIEFYEFCSKNSNDACGKASLNILTGDFIGNWSYYEKDQDKFIKIPVVKTKMWFEKQYLENFNEDVYFNFCHKIYELSCKSRDEMLEKRK